MSNGCCDSKLEVKSQRIAFQFFLYQTLALKKTAKNNYTTVIVNEQRKTKTPIQHLPEADIARLQPQSYIAVLPVQLQAYWLTLYKLLLSV